MTDNKRTNRKRSTSSGATAHRATGESAASTTPADAANAAGTAYIDYVKSLSDSESALQATCGKAYGDYLQNVDRTMREAYERFGEIHRTYMEALATAWTTGEEYDRCQAAYDDYASSLSALASGPARPTGSADSEPGESAPSAEQRVARTGTAYVTALGELQSAGQARASQAFTDYLKSLRTAWESSGIEDQLQEAHQSLSKAFEDAWNARNATRRKAESEATAAMKASYDAAEKAVTGSMG